MFSCFSADEAGLRELTRTVDISGIKRFLHLVNVYFFYFFEQIKHFTHILCVAEPRNVICQQALREVVKQTQYQQVERIAGLTVAVLSLSVHDSLAALDALNQVWALKFCRVYVYVLLVMVYD